MVTLDARLKAEKRRQGREALAIKNAIIGQEFDNQWWLDLGYQTGTHDYVKNHPRLLKSLYFGDDDYPACVMDAIDHLQRAYGNDDLIEASNVKGWLAEHDPKLLRELFPDHAAGSVHDASLKIIHEQGQLLGVPEFGDEIKRIRQGIDDDPAAAIGGAKDLLESVLKTVLTDDTLGVLGKNPKLPALMRATQDQLADEDTPTRLKDSTKKLLNGSATTVQAVAELRNYFGTGHGRSQGPRPDIMHAELCVTSVGAIGLYVLRAAELVDDN